MLIASVLYTTHLTQKRKTWQDGHILHSPPQVYELRSEALPCPGTRVLSTTHLPPRSGYTPLQRLQDTISDLFEGYAIEIVVAEPEISRPKEATVISRLAPTKRPLQHPITIAQNSLRKLDAHSIESGASPNKSVTCAPVKSTNSNTFSKTASSLKSDCFQKSADPKPSKMGELFPMPTLLKDCKISPKFSIYSAVIDADTMDHEKSRENRQTRNASESRKAFRSSQEILDELLALESEARLDMMSKT